jgi:hypothetical protein
MLILKVEKRGERLGRTRAAALLAACAVTAVQEQCQGQHIAYATKDIHDTLGVLVAALNDDGDRAANAGT